MSLPIAVVFDLDGTLIDSAPDLRHALNCLLADEQRRELSLKEVIGMIGDGVPKLVERGYRATGDVPDEKILAERVACFLANYEANATAHTTLFPGALNALKALQGKGVKLGMCTNKPCQATREILEEFELTQYFDTVIGGDSVGGIRKPDARHLLAVLDGLGTTPAETVMVGDSGNDIGVAKNAGIRSVVVTFGYCHGPVESLDADAMIDHFDQLPDALSGLEAG